ncbi:MAG: hypothetical protein ABJB86_16270 [Bacteroidota bacterium]
MSEPPLFIIFYNGQRYELYACLQSCNYSGVPVGIHDNWRGFPGRASAIATCCAPNAAFRQSNPHHKIFPTLAGQNLHYA